MSRYPLYVESLPPLLDMMVMGALPLYIHADAVIPDTPVAKPTPGPAKNEPQVDGTVTGNLLRCFKSLYISQVLC
jgi:hypothetical protein